MHGPIGIFYGGIILTGVSTTRRNPSITAYLLNEVALNETDLQRVRETMRMARTYGEGRLADTTAAHDDNAKFRHLPAL